MNKLIKYQIIIFLLLNVVFAQKFSFNNFISKQDRYWVELSVGKANWENDIHGYKSGYTMYASLNYSKRQYIAKLYKTHIGEANPLPLINPILLVLPTPEDKYNFAGGMIGIKTKGDDLYVSLCTGIGYMSASEAGEKYVYPDGYDGMVNYYYERKKYSRVNVPVEVNAAFTEKYIGLDIKLYAYLSTEQPIYGAICSFYLGKLYE